MAEISRQIRIGWVSFGRLSYIMQNILFKICNTCILPVLTNGAQASTLTKQSTGKFNKFPSAMERMMLGITLKVCKRKRKLKYKLKDGIN